MGLKNASFEEATQTYNDLYISLGIDPGGDVKVFTWENTFWLKKGSNIYGLSNSKLGYSVAISSSTAYPEP